MKKPEDGSIKNAISTNSANATKPDNPFQTVQMCDRVSNAEAMLLGFIAENSLPFTMAPKIVDLAKGLAKDTKALNHLPMERTSASYKMKFGMGKTYFDRTVSNMKRFKFSLNMDQSTSTNLHRVLTVLVSYFSPETSSVVVEHFTSIDLIKVDSATITNHIIDLFATHDIPWTNLTSVLMDSCNMMRGCKSGVEARLRDMAPHLLDIDGDTCHHIHNASKKLCEPFEFWVERLFTDIHNDVKWSTDVRDMMKEVATLIGIKFTMPEQFVSHRWLSCYDVAVNTKRLMDVYRVVYYAFMDKSQQSLYKSVVNDILKKREVSEDAERRVKEIQMELSRKNMTKDGQARKQRIIERLLERNTKTDLVLNFYVSVLPMLKSYIVLFETKEPLIHKLIDKQEELMTKFLACFIVPDAVSNKSGKQLMNLNLTSSEIMLKDRKCLWELPIRN
ncbi:uncharacterized protein LOC127846705 isoform X2 [Dreissena polymorpha]|uniref:uncharacterized protein LOC127846705 isoform X2 n=1 Tax=Dreissena polymorpha TaxID=45954 RepID=UPI0022652CFB|nr:uncharacterized protein LOC127846705 isoform X2 [Dreissena polymorpha]